jgi:hypothetical protein
MIYNGSYGQEKCHQIAKKIINYYFNNLGIKSHSNHEIFISLKISQ